MKTQDIVNVLNDLFKTDPQAIDALLCAVTPANLSLINHPTAMCRSKNENGDFPTFGILGIINAIASVDGDIIEACYDDKTHCLLHFRVREKNNV